MTLLITIKQQKNTQMVTSKELFNFMKEINSQDFSQSMFSIILLDLNLLFWLILLLNVFQMFIFILSN